MKDVKSAGTHGLCVLRGFTCFNTEDTENLSALCVISFQSTGLTERNADLLQDSPILPEVFPSAMHQPSERSILALQTVPLV